jgi:hypothetical protein
MEEILSSSASICREISLTAFSLFEPHPRAAAILVDELDASGFFLMIVLGRRGDLVWHCGRKGNGDGKDNHGNDERGY